MKIKYMEVNSELRWYFVNFKTGKYPDFVLFGFINALTFL